MTPAPPSDHQAAHRPDPLRGKPRRPSAHARKAAAAFERQRTTARRVTIALALMYPVALVVWMTTAMPIDRGDRGVQVFLALAGTTGRDGGLAIAQTIEVGAMWWVLGACYAGLVAVAARKARRLRPPGASPIPNVVPGRVVVPVGLWLAFVPPAAFRIYAATGGYALDDGPQALATLVNVLPLVALCFLAVWSPGARRERRRP